MTKILVAYAGRMGSTAEIAEAIGTQLGKEGFDVDVRPCDRAPDAWKYDAVIVGSAVYIGRWERSALDYLKAQAPDLAERPTWLFQSGPCDEDADAEPVHRAVRRLVDQIGLEQPVTFGGRLDRSRATTRLSRWMATGPYAGDHRRWDRIESWTADVADHLRPTPPSTTATHRVAAALVGTKA